MSRGITARRLHPRVVVEAGPGLAVTGKRELRLIRDRQAIAGDHAAVSFFEMGLGVTLTSYIS